MVLEPTQPPRRRRPIKLWMLGFVLLGYPWLWGLVAFVSADGHIEIVLPRRRTPPAELHNLSLWDLGPTLRASSFYGDWSGHHHPAFLVDGRASPDLVEKWASAERDRHPWVELIWREPHNLERVVLRHAGSLEAADLTVHRYTIHCLGAGRPSPSVEVHDNTSAVVSHDLACTQARGIHIDFEPNDPKEIGKEIGKEIVRIFEVETWGQ